MLTFLLLTSTQNFQSVQIEKNCREKGNLTLSKLEAFADNNFIVAKMVQFFFDREENIVGKGENAGDKQFLLSHNVFTRLLSQVH